MIASALHRREGFSPTPKQVRRQVMESGHRMLAGELDREFYSSKPGTRASTMICMYTNEFLHGALQRIGH
jgi:hypothetical protein